jgi:hypothetical protein
MIVFKWRFWMRRGLVASSLRAKQFAGTTLTDGLHLRRFDWLDIGFYRCAAALRMYAVGETPLDVWGLLA